MSFSPLCTTTRAYRSTTLPLCSTQSHSMAAENFPIFINIMKHFRNKQITLSPPSQRHVKSSKWMDKCKWMGMKEVRWWSVIGGDGDGAVLCVYGLFLVLHKCRQRPHMPNSRFLFDMPAEWTRSFWYRKTLVAAVGNWLSYGSEAWPKQ